jgi:uncharacterized membrane protein YdjX (TVP38/TMEM64 family)
VSPASAPRPQKSPRQKSAIEKGSGSRAGLVAKLVAGVAALAAVLLLGRFAGGYLPGFAAWVKSLGVWGPVVFILGYAVACVLFLPGSILTLAAGVVFGLIRGTLFAFSGAFLGSAAAFLVARYLARGAIEKRLADKPRFAAIDRAVGKDGFKIVALLRLSPLLPFNLLNYALGLTKVRFGAYLAAAVAMLPGTLLYVYYGTLLGDLAKLAGGAKIERGPEQWVFLGVGLVATIAASVVIGRKARQALQENVGGDDHQADGDREEKRHG